LAAGLRQLAPHSLPWRGHWPSSSSSAIDAYKVFAKPGDPGFLSLRDAQAEQRAGKSVFLDARSPSEFNQGHIPGARNLPFYELEKYQEGALKGVDENTPVIIYCEGIGCELSFLLGRELQGAGYKNCRIFYGGYPEWTAAGLPIEK
jgi:rhodanese-related sulfurtransferase